MLLLLLRCNLFATQVYFILFPAACEPSVNFDNSKLTHFLPFVCVLESKVPIGWVSNLTPRSETARLRSNVFKFFDKVGVFLIKWIFTMFRMVSVYQELVTHKRVVALVVSTWVLSGLFSLTRLWIPKSIMYVGFGITQLACIIAATFFSIRIYSSVRLHVNQIQVLQLQHAPQNAQMVNVRRMRKFAMMSVYVCLVLTVCYLPNICTLFAFAFTSRPSTGIKHLQFYTLTLEFLNSSLNPVIYCWKMKHIRHTIIGLIRNAFTKQN